MSISAICRAQSDSTAAFEVAYLKNSVWIERNDGARLMIHCVIMPSKNTAPFSSLRIIVPHDVHDLRNMTHLLLDPIHMASYEDECDTVSVNDSDKSVTGNGGTYFPTDVTFSTRPIEVSDSNPFTEIIINLVRPVYDGCPRGFRIEYNTNNYVREKTKNIFSFHASMYQSADIHCLMMMPEYKNDIVDVAYGDLWVVLPEGRTVMLLKPDPLEIEDFSVRSESGYKEFGLTRDLRRKVAFRWRHPGWFAKSPSRLGPTVHCELREATSSFGIAWVSFVLAILSIILSLVLYRYGGR